MCQNWLLMDENEINKVAGSARNWVVPRINTFVPVKLMTGAIFCRKRGRKMTRAELPEQIETERLVLRVRTVADAEVSLTMRVVQRFLTQLAFHPSRPWKMRFITQSISFPSAIKRTISQMVMGLWSKRLIRLSALLISTIATKTMCWRLAIPCTQTIGVEAMCLKQRVP